MGLDLAAKRGGGYGFSRAGVPRGVFRRGKGILEFVRVVLQIQVQVPSAYDTVAASGIAGK